MFRTVRMQNSLGAQEFTIDLLSVHSNIRLQFDYYNLIGFTVYGPFISPFMEEDYFASK